MTLVNEEDLTPVEEPGIILTGEFKKALKLFNETTNSYLVTGVAGSGKTVLINRFKMGTEKTVASLAPTGAAALHSNSATIHSFCGFGWGVIEPHNIKVYERHVPLAKMLDTIIIDEISMVRADLFQGLHVWLQKHRESNAPFGGAQIIMVGDLYQLAPVVTKDLLYYFGTHFKSPYFFSAPVVEQMDLGYIELSHVFRQNEPKFIKALNGIRNGRADFADLQLLNERVFPEPSRAMFLSSLNKHVTRINNRELAKIKEKEFTFEAQTFGNFNTKDAPAPYRLILKKGARITTLVNKPGAFVNGSVGTIIHLDQFTIKVRIKGLEFILKKHEWDIIKYSYVNGVLQQEKMGSFRQYPIMLGFARSIHKSQGTTYNEPVYANFHGWYLPGLVYVALSRVTKYDNLYLAAPLLPMHLKTNKLIQKFLDEQHNLVKGENERKAKESNEEVSISDGDVSQQTAGSFEFDFPAGYLPENEKESGDDTRDQETTSNDTNVETL